MMFHTRTSDLMIGSSVDHEGDAYQSTNADGDDNNQADDEDGINIASISATGSVVEMDVSVNNNLSSDAQLVCWMDLNQDGDFQDSGERTQPGFASHTLTGGGSGSTFYATAQTNTGVTQPNEALGAPVAPNPSLLANPGDLTGVAHLRANDILILDMGTTGTIPSGEDFTIRARGTYDTTNSTGNGRADIHTSPDNSTWTFAGAISMTGQINFADFTFTAPATARYVRITRTTNRVNVDGITYTAPGGSSCTDTSGITDGTFTTGNVPAGCSGDATVQWTGISSYPTSGNVFIRCRLTTEDGSTSGAANFFNDMSPSPLGPARDGEVEDTVVPSSSLPITLNSFSSSYDAGGLRLDWQTGMEVMNVGFNVYGYVEGEKIKLNKEIIPSKRPDSVVPQYYEERIEVPNGVEQLGISSVDTRGKEDYFGPFEIGVSYGEEVEVKKVNWERVKEEYTQKMISKGYVNKGGVMRSSRVGNGSYISKLVTDSK